MSLPFKLNCLGTFCQLFSLTGKYTLKSAYCQLLFNNLSFFNDFLLYFSYKNLLTSLQQHAIIEAYD